MFSTPRFELTPPHKKSFEGIDVVIKRDGNPRMIHNIPISLRKMKNTSLKGILFGESFHTKLIKTGNNNQISRFAISQK